MINLADPRPDPHTGTDDQAVVLRQDLDMSEMELRLTEQNIRLDNKVDRHIENKKIHCHE